MNCSRAPIKNDTIDLRWRHGRLIGQLHLLTNQMPFLWTDSVQNIQNCLILVSELNSQVHCKTRLQKYAQPFGKQIKRWKGMICRMIDWLVFVDIQKAIKMEHVFVLLANSLPKLINLRNRSREIFKNGVCNDLQTKL